MKISIIGCGKMGSCIAHGLVGEHELSLFDHNEKPTKELAKSINATFCRNAPEAISKADIIILAVKPENLDDVAELIQNETRKEQLIVSVLAGISTQTLQTHFKKNPIIRMMPNIAVRCGTGVVGFEDSKNLSKPIKDKVQKAFAKLGALYWIPENKFNALTALTGSGPAFVFVIIESIIDAGIAMGLSADESKELAIQLFKGSISMIEDSNQHPGELKWSVTSPGGTTIAGVKMMEDCGIRSGIINTFLATYNRAQELSS